jgi:hypothetical protein
MCANIELCEFTPQKIFDVFVDDELVNEGCQSEDDDEDEITSKVVSSSSSSSSSGLTTKKAKTKEEDIKIDEEEMIYSGQWEQLPFVSDKSSWGKAEGERGLRMSFWRPYDSYLEKLILNSSAPTKKSSKKNNSKRSDSSISNIYKSNSIPTTFAIHYTTEDSSAHLDYEDDYEEEEELCTEADTAMKLA